MVFGFVEFSIGRPKQLPPNCRLFFFWGGGVLLISIELHASKP